MEYLGFNPCKADPNIWMKKAKRADNTNYRKYILLYVDDYLAILVDPESIVQKTNWEVISDEGSFYR